MIPAPPTKGTPVSTPDPDHDADYYDTHDTSAEMENGVWVDPTAGQSDR